MKSIWDIAVIHMGSQVNITILYHTFRDVFIIFILWLLGYRGFQLVSTLLLSGFFKAGNGVCYNCDGSHAFFNPLDLLSA